MRYFLALLALSSLALAQLSSPAALSPGKEITRPRETTASGLPDLPPMPKGDATVIGGAIRSLDRVRDQLTLNVFGGRDMKILFDERTQVYRDGKRMSLGNLRPGDRVSVETMLDGTAVFARCVRMLTQSLEGECYGQVREYNRTTGELTLRDTLSPEVIVLRVSGDTRVVGPGQKPASAGDLGAGALISAKFQPDLGADKAREITILAVPGTSFVFHGSVSFLDLHSGVLVLVDPRDKKQYEVSFDPIRQRSGDLRPGAEVTVTAGFDGRRYSATAISVNVPARK